MLLIGMISFTGLCNTPDLIQNSETEINASYDVVINSVCVNDVNSIGAIYDIETVVLSKDNARVKYDKAEILALIYKPLQWHLNPIPILFKTPDKVNLKNKVLDRDNREVSRRARDGLNCKNS